MPAFPNLAVSSLGVAGGKGDGLIVEPLDGLVSLLRVGEGDDSEAVVERRYGDDVDGGPGEECGVA